MMYFAASLTFSDGSWWLTGGLITSEGDANLVQNTETTQENMPSKRTIFFDKFTGIAVDGRSLKSPQAGHCIVEVGKSFVSAGGFKDEV